MLKKSPFYTLLHSYLYLLQKTTILHIAKIQTSIELKDFLKGGVNLTLPKAAQFCLLQ